MARNKILQPASQNAYPDKTRSSLFKEARGNSAKVQGKLNPRRGKGATFARFESENIPVLAQAEPNPPTKESSSGAPSKSPITLAPSTRANRKAGIPMPRLFPVKRPPPERDARLRRYKNPARNSSSKGPRDEAENSSKSTEKNKPPVERQATLVLQATQDEKSEDAGAPVVRQLETGASGSQDAGRKRAETESWSSLFSER